MKTTEQLVAALGVTAAGLIATPFASAQEGPENLYGAIEAGVGIISQEGTTFLGPIDETEQSAIIGGAIGARSNFGTSENIVLGLEAGGDLYTDASEWRYGIYGIGGVKVRDDDIVYLRVGYGSFADDAMDLDGLVLGAGYELSLNDRLSIRFDYRSLFYGDTDSVDNSIDNHGHEITTALVFHPWAAGR